MNSDQSDSSESKTIEALVPMVDLFAVLAIMFMIYSNDEITYAKQENAAEIQRVVEDERREIREEDQARKDRREYLAKEAGKSLEQLKAEQAQRAQELIEQFTNMVAVQQSQAAIEYEELVSNIEFEHEEELEKELASLNEESRANLATKKVELETDLENRKRELEEEKKEELVLARLQHEKDVVFKVIELTSEKQEALARSRQENAQLMHEQKSTFERKREDELRALKREHQEEIASADKVLEDTRGALADSDQQRQEESTQQKLELGRQKTEMVRVERALKEQAASQAARLEGEKERALAEAEQQRLDALSAQERELESQLQLALAKAEEGRKAQAASLAEKLEAEKELALAKAEQEHRKLQAERETALAKADEAEKLASAKELALARVVDELNPYLKAEEAKQKIVEQLNQNFEDFDSEAVEIDEKTGKVKLHFRDTYFARGSHQLSEDMKSFLRIMIPKYAKSIYENEGAAKHVESLKISGMTSPIYFGKYVDINDSSHRTARARRYNMTLSNKRALAMYNFIFDEAEMSSYRYRDRLKADMGISALGFQNAKPVMDELIGQPADCIKYDCKHEQATVLQFYLLSEN